MAEDEFRFDEVLGELRARMLNVPCPECGKVPQRVVREGEEVKCEGCGLTYTVEKYLSDTGVNVTRRIVESVLAKFRVPVSEEIRESFAVFEEYANAVLGELRRLHKAQDRLPSPEELDCAMSAHTERILNRIAQETERLRSDHHEIKLEMKRSFGKLTSLSLDVRDIKRLLEILVSIPRDYWRPVQAPSPQLALVSLTYCDPEGRERRVDLSESELAGGVILGRDEHGWCLRLKLSGETRELGLADMMVSRTHAKIVCQNGRIFIEDLGSKNKTYINDVELKPGEKEALRNGDTIRLGPATKFKVKM